jgi:hypothetical protein
MWVKAPTLISNRIPVGAKKAKRPGSLCAGGVDRPKANDGFATLAAWLVVGVMAMALIDSGRRSRGGAGGGRLAGIVALICQPFYS